MNAQLSYIYIIMLALQLSSLPDDRGYSIAVCLELGAINFAAAKFRRSSQLGNGANRDRGIVEYVIIEDRTIRPTNDQAQSCLRVCQMLSNSYRDIKLFRFNPEKGYVFIMAGDNLQIMIFTSGLWRFIDETEL